MKFARLRASLLLTLGLSPVAGLPACGSHSSSPSIPPATRHSSSLALSADNSTLYVVNPDSDSVSFIDVATRTVVHEVFLSGAPPVQDPTTQRFDPAVSPRALALSKDEKTLYVTGQRSGFVYALDTATGAISATSTAGCSEPVGVLPSSDGASVYVACSEDSAVLKLAAPALTLSDTVTTPAKPWALGWNTDETALYVSHLLGPGVSLVSPETMTLSTTWAFQNGPPQADPGTLITPYDEDAGSPPWEDPTLPHGVVRGIYDVLARPGTDEVWSLHLMLGIDTPEPALVFNNTAFPAVSVFDAQGDPLARLSVSVVAQDQGAFGDVVSGPHALAFTPDGLYAFVVDSNSEDVLVVDAKGRVEATLVRPLPGHQPEGVAVSSNGHVYVDERNTGDVAILDYSEDGGVSATVSGTIAKSTAADPMPATMRLGQHIFHSANSDELPLTQNHWVACASCHIEERSDAVTWLFLEGPRDTPSNAGGVSNTGFLLRTAGRTTVQDYWQTINSEQGGSFLDPDAGGTSAGIQLLSSDLDALASYVNYAIPYPVPPSGLDPNLVDAGSIVFANNNCARCHAGPYFTDSAYGNPMMDLTGPVVQEVTDGGVLLHEAPGQPTCVTTGIFPDVSLPDELGDPRPACLFDTPTLRGIADSAPYLHNGSAATLADVLPYMVAGQPLSATDQAALIEYLRSL